jgi:hypothetical protein
MDLPPAIAGTLESLALLAIGYNLRKAGLFDLADAQARQCCSVAAAAAPVTLAVAVPAGWPAAC